MNTIDIQTASMSDLVAFYNANSGKPAIKKFSDKQTGQARCQSLMDNAAAAESARGGATSKVEAVQPEVEETKMSEQPEVTNEQPETQPEVTNEQPEVAQKADWKVSCPFCGGSDVTPDGAEGSVAGDERNYCHPCDKSYWIANGKEFKTKQKISANIAAAVAASWGNAETRAKRTERHFVTVSVDGGAPTQFNSTKQGWVAYGLPQGRHIAFRAKMKAAGEAGLTYEFNGRKYHFTAFETPKAEPKAKAEPKLDENGNPIVSKRGRPAGSKNKPKDGVAVSPDAGGAAPVGSPDEVDAELLGE